MKIESLTEKNNVPLSKVAYGEAFRYMDKVYIRALIEADLKITALDPKDGMPAYFPESIQVERLPDAKIIC